MGSYHLIITDFIFCNKCFYMYTKLCVYIYIYTFVSNQYFVHLQFSSVTQLCPTLCDPIDCSMPGFPVLHHLPELAQTLSIDATQLSHPLSSPSPPPFNHSQHQGLFHQVAKVLELQLQPQSFERIFRTDFL